MYFTNYALTVLENGTRISKTGKRTKYFKIFDVGRERNKKAENLCF